MEIEFLIQHFGLLPHPEGGYFTESYRSSTVTNTESGIRNHSTAVYFLLPADTKSHLHRIKSDEVWHFYVGGPLSVFQISPEGKVTETLLGNDLKAGHLFQHVVPAGHWFGAVPKKESRYSFVGCTVSPGFDFKDFEMAERSKLLATFPHARNIIEQLTL